MAKVTTEFKEDNGSWAVGDIIVIIADETTVGMITFTNGVYALTDLSTGGTLRLYSKNRLFQKSELVDLKKGILCDFEVVERYSGDRVKITLSEC